MDHITHAMQLVYRGDYSPLVKENEHIFIDYFIDHAYDVLKYFESRPCDMLLLTMDDGDSNSFDVISRFTGIPEPSKKFPHHHVNSADRANRSYVQKCYRKGITEQWLSL